jgi:hypothetical protein
MAGWRVERSRSGERQTRRIIVEEVVIRLRVRVRRQNSRRLTLNINITLPEYPIMFRCSLITLLVLTMSSLAGDPPSGPNVGDKLQEFKVLGFSGSEAGKEFEVLKQTKNGPTLLVFVHQISRPALKLLRPLDEYASKEEKLAAHIVWLSGDKDETTKFLERAKNSLNLQTPISISIDGKDGPPAYGLNDKVAVTILVAKDRKVVANFAFADPNETVARKVIQAVAKVLGKDSPKK